MPEQMIVYVLLREDSSAPPHAGIGKLLEAATPLLADAAFRGRPYNVELFPRGTVDPVVAVEQLSLVDMLPSTSALGKLSYVAFYELSKSKDCQPRTINVVREYCYLILFGCVYSTPASVKQEFPCLKKIVDRRRKRKRHAMIF